MPLQFAGSTSAQHFRRNLLLRLAEALFNLEWLRNHDPNYDANEHDAMKRAVRLLEAPYGDYAEYDTLRNRSQED